MCEYICEARKNAENRMTDVFICYDEHEKKIRDSVGHIACDYVCLRAANRRES
jgi:hypothetical protein